MFQANQKLQNAEYATKIYSAGYLSEITKQ